MFCRSSSSSSVRVLDWSNAQNKLYSLTPHDQFVNNSLCLSLALFLFWFSNIRSAILTKHNNVCNHTHTLYTYSHELTTFMIYCTPSIQNNLLLLVIVIGRRGADKIQLILNWIKWKRMNAHKIDSLLFTKYKNLFSTFIKCGSCLEFIMSLDRRIE